MTIGNNPPTASFTASPNPAVIGNRRSASTARVVRPRRLDRQVRVGPRRQRHATRPTPARPRPPRGPTRRRAASRSKLRVTDQGGLTTTVTQTVTVVAPQPAADGLLHGHAEPGHHGRDGDLQRRRPRAIPTARSRSTSGTSTATAATRPTPARRPRRREYATAGTVTVGLRVTDADGMTGTKTVPVSSTAAARLLPTRVLARPACANYWRMGETTGRRSPTPRARARRPPPAAPRSAPPARCGDGKRSVASTASTAPRRRRRPARREQADGRVLAQVERLRQRRRAWRWSSRRTSTTTAAASSSTRTPRKPAAGSGSRIGNGASRNNVYFARPSAGAWHHYAFVLDTTAPRRHPDHAVRRRPAGDVHQDRERHGRRATSRTRRLLHVAGRHRPCSAPATSTSSPSTTRR